MRELIKKVLQEQVQDTPNPKLVGKLINYLLRHPKLDGAAAQRVFNNFGVANGIGNIYGDELISKLNSYRNSHNADPKFFYIVELTKAHQVMSQSGYVYYNTILYYFLSQKDYTHVFQNLKGMDLMVLDQYEDLYQGYLWEENHDEDENRYVREKFGLKLNRKVFEYQALDVKLHFTCPI